MHCRFSIFVILLSLLFTVPSFGIKSPSVSANTLFLFQNSNFHKEDANASSIDQQPNGLDVREAELQFYSDVDPYTRLNLLLSIAPSYSSDGVKVSQQWGIEPEEVFAESNVVQDVTFKFGKFRTAMGKHNVLHTHAFPFIEAPIMNTKLLGDEGLNDVGVSAAILLPSSWFSELTMQYVRGKGENEEFNSPSPGKGVAIVHWKNMVDVSDELGLEIGGSYASGDNSYRRTTTLAGADLTLKWRPSEGGLYTSVIWSTEYLSRTQAHDILPAEYGSGVSSGLKYQFAQRWSTLYRIDTLTIKDSLDPTILPNDIWQRHSVGFAFASSEFSSYQLEWNHSTGGLISSSNESTERSIFLQANFTIGAHPAHSY